LVALGLPSVDLADEAVAAFDALVEVLALENADLNFAMLSQLACFGV
jgi:hypothetical protein